MLRMILTDCYSGIYSGGKWLLINNYCEKLTEIELEEVNEHLIDTDKFYTTGPFEGWYDGLCSVLNTGATRFDAVEATFQGQDCYTSFKGWTWLRVFDSLIELNKVVKYQDERRINLNQIKSYKNKHGFSSNISDKRRNEIIKSYQNDLVNLRKEFYK